MRLFECHPLDLFEPVGSSKPNMWPAAIEPKVYKVTVVGEHYRKLVALKLKTFFQSSSPTIFKGAKLLGLPMPTLLIP